MPPLAGTGIYTIHPIAILKALPLPRRNVGCALRTEPWIIDAYA